MEKKEAYQNCLCIQRQKTVATNLAEDKNKMQLYLVNAFHYFIKAHEEILNQTFQRILIKFERWC